MMTRYLDLLPFLSNNKSHPADTRIMDTLVLPRLLGLVLYYVTIVNINSFVICVSHAENNKRI